MSNRGRGRRLVGASFGSRWLLASVSALALCAAGPQAMARPLGGASTSATSAALAAVQDAQSEAQRAALAAQRALSGATRALQAAQAAQQAARDAARLQGNQLSPNGLQGLRIGSDVLRGDGSINPDSWTGAKLPVETIGAGRTQVGIEQTQSRAVLSWDRFDVGASTDLVFDQKGNADWIALNRVVGASTSPSQILGTIKADGTVLVINQNGIIFGAGSQINTHSLIASTLEVGRATGSGGSNDPRTIAQRNAEFLEYGLTGYNETFATPGSSYPTFSGVTNAASAPASPSILVEKGARIESSGGGAILLLAAEVVNAGWLSAAGGQVSLAGAPGRVTLTPSDGSDTAEDPYVRGYLVGSSGGSVTNTGLIEADRGYISLGSSMATVTNSGILSSTTSVSANGTIDIVGKSVGLASGSVIMISPDQNGETIPQDASSIASFRPSHIRIGNSASTIVMGSGATVVAPSGEVTFGAGSGVDVTSIQDTRSYDAATGQWTEIAGSITIESGAVIDVSGLKDVAVPVSSYNFSILLKRNELADSGGYQDSFLNGETVWVDTRRSGVREDGVAWIGSPLLSVAAYSEAVGASVEQMMTRGGKVVLGTNAGATSSGVVPKVTVAPNARIDISGGWLTYEAGFVRTTNLVTSTGRIVNIGDASLSDTYIGIAGSGFTRDSERWGVTDTWASPVSRGSYYSPSYTEGLDAGSLTLKTSLTTFQGTLNAAAYASARQLAAGQVGTGTSSVFNDMRNVQEVRSQLPAGGMLFVQQLGESSTINKAGADIVVVAAADDAPQTGTTVLSDRLLSNSGLSQVSLWSGGSVSVNSGAVVELAAGGVFDAYSGGAIKVSGTVSAASGQILLETARFATSTAVAGGFDVVVDGTLSVAGRWVNDFGKLSDRIAGPAYLDGGSISMVSAATVTDQAVANNANTIAGSTDISGSIRIADAQLIDLSGGGRVDFNGKINLAGRGGDLTLVNETAFFQTALATYSLEEQRTYFGQSSGFRSHYLGSNGLQVALQINPAEVTSTVEFDPAVIRAAGFTGGGTFTLWAPDVKFGSGSADDAANATALPLDFFQKGFSNYAITSYKTALIDNTFVDGSGASFGGKNALLQTQTFTVKAGETLNLTQALLPSILSAQSSDALRHLATGDDVNSVLTAAVPTQLWDQKAVNLTLDGMVELKVASGGNIVAAPGATLTVAKLVNEGTIRLPSGNIVQSQTLPQSYSNTTRVFGVHDLAEVFTVRADGTIVATSASQLSDQTNAQAAMLNEIYLLGELDAADGIVLAEGSVTDLSGVSVIDPHTTDLKGYVVPDLRTGRIYDAGAIKVGARGSAGNFYRSARMTRLQQQTGAYHNAPTLAIAGGASVLLNGTSDSYVEAGARGATAASLLATRQVWSNAGSISTPNGFTISSDALLSARGGSAQAEGGTLSLPGVVLTQSVADAAQELSADQLMASGFTTLVALGSLNSQGDVTLRLDRALFVASRPYGSVASGSPTDNNVYAVVIGAGGDLSITAPYIGLLSTIDVLLETATGTPASHSVSLNATKAFDVSGAVLFDQSVASANLTTGGDFRMSGVGDYRINFLNTAGLVNSALTSRLAVNGDLVVSAAQVYPTTGTTAIISTGKPDGSIIFARSTSALPTSPYSAGGNLTVSAGTIVQGGVIRVPLGQLTLAATGNLTLADGSYTEVSANGLVIPYGTTTDGVEWYFTPTGGDALTAPPEKMLTLSGANIGVASGATVNVSGGGDLTAYEFAAGTGGSRDVLNALNDDPYTSANGCTYAGCAQVYAIVPGLSDAAVAAYDPVYSATHSELSSVAGTGSRVQLDIGEGLKWYTLLPAKYATLPGGKLVVQQTASTALTPGNTFTRADGTLLAVGSYGDALSGATGSATHIFAVQSQDVFNRYSAITLTSANSYFADLADGAVPPLPVDAGKLVLDATASLAINAALQSGAAPGGRGAKVDIGGSVISIVSVLPATPVADTLSITADSLSNLRAESLLIGARRTDNADGSTTLSVSAGSITVANDAGHVVSAGEIVLAATGTIVIADGSVITAVGTMTDDRDGAYVIGTGSTSGTGALLRVANGPERLTSRSNFASTASFAVGAATLSGTAVMFDSSGAVSLSSLLELTGTSSVALGAGRIGLGITDPGYDGLKVTPEMQAVLTQAGGRLTLRAQTSIDFADGSYRFGALRLDAPTLAGTGGGAVSVSAGAVTLGNASVSGAPCTACDANGGNLTINASEIVFAAGTIATKATTTASTVTARLSTDTVVTIPAGTYFRSGYYFVEEAKILVKAGTVVTLDAGTGIVTPVAADGTLPAGTEITAASLGFTMTAGSYALAEDARVYYSALQPNQTVVAGTALSFTATPTVTIPTGAPLDLAADAALSSTDFFAGGVTLAASNGMFVAGKSAGLDAGSAALTLHTPYIGDRAGSTIGDLTLATRGALAIDNAGGAAFDVAGIGNTPGTALRLTANAISISGTRLRASAGMAELVAETSLALSNGAVVEAPGVTETFGDATDSTNVAAKGGTVRLTAKTGDITLGAGTLVSVAGASGAGAGGDAGRLELAAVGGAVSFGGRLDGSASTGSDGTAGKGGTFALETGGSVDLVALNTLAGGYGFTGGFEVRSRSGNLELAAGQTLKSGSVVLTADGGFVAIGGTIDTSGANGGDIALWGNKGVTLSATALLDAHADGYADTDPRQAAAGNITLGTDFIAGTTTTDADGAISGTSGAIAIAAGARLDLGARKSGNRIIPLDSGLGYYYVAGDTGGTLTLRAPVIGGNGNQTVQVDVASAASVTGASSIVLEGFGRWDLTAVASSGSYSGVTASGGNVTLDASAGLDSWTNSCVSAGNCSLGATVNAGLNFLGDRDWTGTHETIVSFVQDLDLTASYARLGGLAARTDAAGRSIFRVAPGVDLASTGSVTLASNWNLAAGAVDVAGATAAGLMGIESYNGTSVNYIVPGSETSVLQDYTSMLYRSGGSVTGSAPTITLRAGGDLVIDGIVNDGFFSFQNAEDATYRAAASGITTTTIGFGASYKTNAVSLSGGVGILLDYNATNATKRTTTSAAQPLDYVPYSAEANSAAPGRGSDLFGTMELFPTLGTSEGKQMSSASYRFTAGAAVWRDYGGQIAASVNPVAIDPLSFGSAIIDGSYSYTTSSGGAYTVLYGAGFSLTGNNCTAVTAYCASSVDQWLGLVAGYTAGRTFTGTSVYWGTKPEHYMTSTGRTTFITAPTTSSSQYVINSTSDLLYMKLNLTSANVGVTINGSWTTVSFRDYVKSGADPYLYALYFSESTSVTTVGQVVPYTLNGQTQNYTMGGDDFFTVVGTSGGATQNPFIDTNANNVALVVSVKTAAYIMENYVAPLFPTSTGTTTTSNIPGMIRTGTGNIAIAASGNVDLTAGLSAASTANAAAVYTAGQRAAASATASALNVATGQTASVNLAANQVAGGLYLENGGNVTIAAGQDVLGHSASIVGTASKNVSLAWMANTTSATSQTSPLADQHLNIDNFKTGVGVLAGGDITITAGRDLDDVAAAATPAIRTVSIMLADGRTAQGIQFLGDSDVVLSAGRDLAGGLVYVTSGNAVLAAQRDMLASAGRLLNDSNSLVRTTRLRLTNAVADVSAGRDLALNWAQALPYGLTNGASWMSPVSSLSVIANGGITLDVYREGSLGAFDGTPVPGSLTLAALKGDLNFLSNGAFATQPSLFMLPDPDGQLVLVAGGSIGAATIVMDDADPANLPGPFWNPSTSANRGLTFPTVTSQTNEGALRLYHNESITHAGDTRPVFVGAGGDITGLILSVPKQARVVAGNDIVDMMFFGQNLSATDITRVAAGGDITATSSLIRTTSGTTLATLGGNTFIIGGPGSFFLEAGGDIGPFLNSARVTSSAYSSACACTITTTNDYSGGVVSVGYDWNPWLKQAVKVAGSGADLYIMFGLGENGADYATLREKYVNPANASALAWGGYSEQLVAWMKQRHGDLVGSNAGADEAYAAFAALPELEQRIFLLGQVYFTELQAAAVVGGPSYLKYSRGYEAVNTLFPASRGFTANGLEGGAVDAALLHTGDLDLRLATLQTTRGGDIRLLGPGGNIIAGSVVRTSAQAERRGYLPALYSGLANTDLNLPGALLIEAIPTSLEGIVTLRGGAIESFTDASLILNQSRMFTQGGGDITAWSSNGDVNAGQGPKTAANFPPIALSFDWNLYAEVDKQAGVSGAGIGAFQPDADSEAPDVYLLAPRGTVDAGDAGVRAAGNISVVANLVRNADNFTSGGTTSGVPVFSTSTDVGGLLSASRTKETPTGDAVPASTANAQPSVIIVEFLGFGGGDGGSPQDEEERRRKTGEGQQHSSYDPNSIFRVIGSGELTAPQMQQLTSEERAALGAR